MAKNDKKDGPKVKRADRFDHSGESVIATFTTSKNKSENAPEVVTSVAFDFADVSAEELRELACRDLIIRVQRAIRSEWGATVPASISVREMLDAEPRRGPIDPAKALVRLVSGLDDTALDAMIASTPTGTEVHAALVRARDLRTQK